MGLAFSCNNDYLIPNRNVPDWLKERIAADEKAINEDPKSNLNIAAWIRYEYQKQYYFEYHNMISSAFPPVYSFEGELFNFTDEIFADYMDNKCCMKDVWKGDYYSLNE